MDDNLPKVTVGVALTLETRAQLAQLAKDDYRSMSAACRALIEEGLARRKVEGLNGSATTVAR